MNLNHFRVFYTVAKNLSYSRAAEELYTSQSSVSIQIKKLEESLGIELFEQMGKKIYLTEAGAAFFACAERVFGLITEARQTIDEIKGYSKGRVFIGASTTPGIYLVPKIIGEFKKYYPGVIPKLQIANSKSVEEMVSKNRLDFGIIGEETTYPGDIHIEPWLKDELLLIFPKGHPLAELSEIKLKNLADFDFILREPGSSTRMIVENSLLVKGFNVKIAMELNNTEAVKQAVSSGLGISIVSKLATIGTTNLICKPISDFRLFRMLNVIYHREKTFSPAAQKFLVLLRQWSGG
ncbi:LysR family transcriptional regulator [Desulfotomaculum sp. 1211_IL3151]|uniref:LysR family transcriptional regulator n=1 Tax=Desulfotomaculum sp. 1211_IL3151 TaxID=3084055 RepID=UPI002FD9BCF3